MTHEQLKNNRRALNDDKASRNVEGRRTRVRRHKRVWRETDRADIGTLRHVGAVAERRGGGGETTKYSDQLSRPTNLLAMLTNER